MKSVVEMGVELPRSIWLMLCGKYVGKGGSVSQRENTRGVIFHDILLTGVVENKGVKEKLPQVKGVDTE